MDALYQKIEIEENQLFIIKNYVVPHFDGLLHFHPEYELTYINKGNGTCLIGDKFMPYNTGDLFLLGPNLTHSWKSDQAADDNSHSIVIQLNHDLWKGAFFSGKELSRINDLFERCHRGLRFSGEAKEQIPKEISGILKCPDDVQNLIKVLSILDTLSKCKNSEFLTSPAYRPKFRKDDYQKINAVYTYVHENFKKEISLNTVSRLLNMTNSGFCRYFKKLTRRTFFSYLNEYRIGIACGLLNQSDLNTTEISYQSGFQSISNFNKQFNLITGFSPREYKKQMKPPLTNN